MSSTLLELLASRKVFIDTSIFIHAFEGHPAYLPFSEWVFNNINKKNISPVTSIITLAEVLVQPFRNKDEELVTVYSQIFHQLPKLKLLSPTDKTAMKAAKIRAQYNFELDDSFQLALSVEEKTDVFLAKDKQLKKFKEVKVLVLEDFV